MLRIKITCRSLMEYHTSRASDPLKRIADGHRFCYITRYGSGNVFLVVVVVMLMVVVVVYYQEATALWTHCYVSQLPSLPRSVTDKENREPKLIFESIFTSTKRVSFTL